MAGKNAVHQSSSDAQHLDSKSTLDGPSSQLELNDRKVAQLGTRHALRPVTVKQMLNAQLLYSGTHFTIDGHEIDKITTVGHVCFMDTSHPTSDIYHLEDGSRGSIVARKWKGDSLDPNLDVRTTYGVTEDVYVRVVGHLQRYRDRNSLNVLSIRKVTDSHEMSYHFLEAMFTTLAYERGPPLSGSLCVSADWQVSPTQPPTSIAAGANVKTNTELSHSVVPLAEPLPSSSSTLIEVAQTAGRSTTIKSESELEHEFINDGPIRDSMDAESSMLISDKWKEEGTVMTGNARQEHVLGVSDVAGHPGPGFAIRSDRNINPSKKGKEKARDVNYNTSLTSISFPLVPGPPQLSSGLTHASNDDGPLISPRNQWLTTSSSLSFDGASQAAASLSLQSASTASPPPSPAPFSEFSASPAPARRLPRPNFRDPYSGLTSLQRRIILYISEAKTESNSHSPYRHILDPNAPEWEGVHVEMLASGLADGRHGSAHDI